MPRSGLRFALGTAIVFLVALAAVVVLYVAQPTSYRIARTRTITAAPDRVMAQLTDLRAFEAWDPWPAEPGRTPIVTYSVVSSGLGAWVDRRDARGGARITIRSISADEVVMTNQTSGTLGGNVSTQTFTVRSSATGSEVCWTFGAGLRGLARFVYPFVHVEERIGPQMDAALARLDRAARR